MLDEILPGRVKSVKEWMEKAGFKGAPASVLKDYHDGAGRKKLTTKAGAPAA